MKTVKLDGVYKRLSDQDAEVYVNLKGWSYAPKSEWKAITRKPKEEEPQPVLEEPKKVKNANTISTLQTNRLKVIVI